MGHYGFEIRIEVVKGGYILTYPTDENDSREVFSTSKKLQSRLEEIIDLLNIKTTI